MSVKISTLTLIYLTLVIFSGEVGYDWEYFKFPKLVTAELIPYGNNTFELVIVVRHFFTIKQCSFK